MAYNIILYTKTDPLHPLLWLDLGIEEVRRLFVSPYISGDDILVKGRIPIHPEDIDLDRVRITLTPDRSEYALPLLVARSVDEPGGAMIPEIRFALEGIAVTQQFLPIQGQKPNESRSGYPKEKTVFVAHGRNELMRLNLFSLLRAVDLHPLEWQQAINATRKAAPPTMEIIETALLAAQAMVILLTPDDEGRLRENFRKPDDPTYETELTGQARQNVTFEAGMAWAINSQRTILIEVGAVRPFSDLAGISFVKLNNSPERRHEFVQKLALAGCRIDITGTDWLTTNVADFEPNGDI